MACRQNFSLLPLPNNAQPVAPSSVRANSQTLIAPGMAAVSEAVAWTASGIKEILANYRRAAAALRFRFLRQHRERQQAFAVHRFESSQVWGFCIR